MLGGNTAVRVAVTNTYLPALERLHSLFGGTVRRTKRVDRDEVRQAYQWYAGGEIAEAFLVSVIPFLYVKHIQAVTAIRFRRGENDPNYARQLVRNDKRYEYRV